MELASVNDEDIEAMELALFTALASRHPECEGGDFDLGALMVLRRALRQAAATWVTANTEDM